MPSPSETREALQLVNEQAVRDAVTLSARLSGSPEQQRALLLENVPAIVEYYAEGSAALAADFYEDQRELAGVITGFTPEAIVLDRTVRLRRAVAWASEPLFATMDATVATRLAGVVQLDVARGFWDTVTQNRQQDPDAVGWRRIASGKGCPFCRMLADRGAVYRHDTALFAAHPNCHCSAEPVFKTDTGPEASVMQYLASKSRRSPAQQAALRDYLDTYY